MTITFLYTINMTNIKQQKSNLAKLMATENITVLHKKIPTAYFDVKNRILACPTFKDDISPELYDLFMGHEVGHALHTPFEGLHSTLKENKTHKGYLNVVEDVRIERKIKEKFSGLRKSFYKAYNELMERDFFGIKNRNLQELSLIDKINLITKCGSRVQISLTDEEQVFLDMAEACETWEEVVECATAIYEWSKENETRDENDTAITDIFEQIEDEDGEEGEESFENDYSDSDEDYEDNLPDINGGNDTSAEELDEEGEEDGDDSDDGEEDEDIKDTGKKNQKSAGRHDDEDGARESLTEHYAHNNEDKYLDENASVKTFHDLSIHEDKFSKVLYGYKNVLTDWRTHIEKGLNSNEKDSKYSDYASAVRVSNYGPKIRKYMTDKNKKIINHMAKEFEMRQSALASKKAQTSKSGQLDMNRLAKYQIVDDVFKRVTYMPEGKNHGVTVLVDWSGSISNEVKDILEQTFILAEFCKKVQIPFRIYLFSDMISKSHYHDDDDSKVLYNDFDGALVEILSNEMTNREYQEAMNYLSYLYLSYWSQKAHSWNRETPEANTICNILNIDHDDMYVLANGYDFPYQYRLGGTPLNQCVIALRKLLPEFNKNYSIEKSILTVITDGYSHGGNFIYETQKEREDLASQNDGDQYCWRTKRERFLLDPYTKRPFKLNNGSNRGDWDTTANLLDWISQTCDVTVTGYFIFSKKRDFSAFIYNQGFHNIVDDKDWTEVRKTGKVINVKGYNKLFLTASTTLTVQGEDGLSDDLVDAQKGRITSAFKRNQKSKTTSRFLTNEFIKEIA